MSGQGNNTEELTTQDRKYEMMQEVKAHADLISQVLLDQRVQTMGTVTYDGTIDKIKQIQSLAPELYNLLISSRTNSDRELIARFNLPTNYFPFEINTGEDKNSFLNIQKIFNPLASLFRQEDPMFYRWLFSIKGIRIDFGVLGDEGDTQVYYRPTIYRYDMTNTTVSEMPDDEKQNIDRLMRLFGFHMVILNES